MSPESLPIKLRQARGAMSLVEAAEVSGIPEERIRMYEEGVRRPYGKTLRRLADVYGLRVAELVGPGQVARPRSRRADVRRRRRRIAISSDDTPIAVPLEVAEGQTVRLVIELVVRRRASDSAGAGEEEDVPVVSLNGPLRREEVAAGVPEALEARAPAEPAGRRAEQAHGLRGTDEMLRQPRDPILELKRAYKDFRHKKS